MYEIHENLKGEGKMKFTKIQGNGNDFIVMENMEGQFSSDFLSSLALKVCERRQSLGADGILVMESSDKGDFKMRLFNSDGSEGEMCGNGARCIARYAFEKGKAPASMSFETLAGDIHAFVEGRQVKLDMGCVKPEVGISEGCLEFQGKEFGYFFLQLGVPHCVIFLPGAMNVSREHLVALGRSVRNRLDLFPNGTNVNFVEITGDDSINAVTYERGVEDLTESCGTGSSASALVSFFQEGLSTPVQVTNPGGLNVVHISREKEEGAIRLFLEGSTLIVAEGEIVTEALKG